MSTLKKPNLTGLRRESAASCKPPYLRDGVPTVVYVTEQGREHHHPATSALFSKVHGVPMARQRHSGYAVRMDDNFVFLFDSDGKVCNVHTYPKVNFSQKAPPTEWMEHETVDIKVDCATGDMSVTKIPLDVTPNMVENLLRKLDQLSEIANGQRISDNITVENATSNELHVRVVVAPQEVVTTLGAVQL